MLPQSGIAYRDAGLPNIEGWFIANQDWIGNDRAGTFVDGKTYFDGAFYRDGPMTQSSAVHANGSGIRFKANITFDASRSNAIYGSSETIQPSAMTVNYYIRAR